MAAEFVGRAVLQTRMWPDIIVMPTPDFHQDAGLGAAAEPLHAQTLVSKLAAEAPVGSVLPGFARID